MRYPIRDHISQGLKSATPPGEIQCQIELIASCPVGVTIGLAQYFNFGARCQSQKRNKRQTGRKPATRDCFLIGADQRTVWQRDYLRPKEQLRCPQYEGI